MTRDPEYRTTQSGLALTKFGLAWNMRTRDGSENVSFFEVTCWAELAENVSKSNLAKGSRVVVVGRLDQNTYETQNNEKRSSVQIIADEVSPSLRWATVDVAKSERFNNTSQTSQARQEPSHSQASESSGETSNDSGDNFDEEPF